MAKIQLPSAHNTMPPDRGLDPWDTRLGTVLTGLLEKLGVKAPSKPLYLSPSLVLCPGRDSGDKEL